MLIHVLLQKVSSEGIQWENEHTFKDHVVHRVERAALELRHFQRAGVSSVADAHALVVLGGRSKLKYL